MPTAGILTRTSFQGGNLSDGAHHTMHHRKRVSRGRPATAYHERSGLTIVELLVALAVVGILLSLLIPAIAASRESARRTQCANHLKQIGLAVTDYEGLHRYYPWGIDWKYEILPQLGLKTVYDKKAPFDPAHPELTFVPIQGIYIPLYSCPSDPQPKTRGAIAGSNYAGCSGSGISTNVFNGVFSEAPSLSVSTFPAGGQRVSASDIYDGLSHTAMCSELLLGSGDMDAVLRTNYNLPTRGYSASDRLALVAACDAIPNNPTSFGYGGDPWAHGWIWYDGNPGRGLYNHGLPPNRPSCYNGAHVPTGVYTAASLHHGGVNVSFADGHVRFISERIDSPTWRQLGSRDPAAR